MTLSIGNRPIPRPVVTDQIELFPYDNYPFSTLRPIEMVAGWGKEWAEKANAALASIPGNRKKYQFLHQQINDPALFDHPKRDDAITRYHQYKSVLIRAIDTAIWCEYSTQESVWNLMTPQQRTDHQVDWAWFVDASEPDITGTILNRPELADIDIKAFCGPRNDLVWVVPYRYEIERFVERRFLDPPSDHARWERQQQRERAARAAIDANIRKAATAWR